METGATSAPNPVSPVKNFIAFSPQKTTFFWRKILLHFPEKTNLSLKKTFLLLSQK